MSKCRAKIVEGGGSEDILETGCVGTVWLGCRVFMIFLFFFAAALLAAPSLPLVAHDSLYRDNSERLLLKYAHKIRRVDYTHSTNNTGKDTMSKCATTPRPPSPTPRAIESLSNLELQ